MTQHTQPNTRPQVVPRADFFRSAEAYAMHIEVPGVRADAIELDFGERSLTLEAEAPELGVQFRRVFRVPRDASMDAVDATLNHGLLRLRVPRHASDSGKRIEVTAG
jgi:HSP20 family molecular chaperone IbpA